MINKIFNEWLLFVTLGISVLYLRFQGVYADSLYMLISLMASVFFVYKLFVKAKHTTTYVNAAYLKIIYVLFILVLLYSVILNTVIRLIIADSIWRVLDMIAVFSIGALFLFALSNLSRVVRTLRSKEVDETKPFYISMILRIACFLLIIHLPTYAPSYRAKAIKNVETRSTVQNFTTSVQADFDGIVNKFVKEIPLQGVSLYLKKGDRQYEGHAGVINSALQRRPNATDFYQIASVSKVLTATLLADFLKEGILDTNTVLSDIYDATNWPGEMGGVNVVSLATHMSGVPRLSTAMQEAALKQMLKPYHYYDGEAFLKDLQTTNPVKEKSFQYSNFGYAVLGQALTKVTGMDYLDGRGLLNNFKVRVGTPYGMKSIGLANQVIGKNAVYAASTLPNGKPIPRWTNSQIVGAGTFIATLDDLKAFVNTYLKDHLQPDFGRNYTSWWATQFIKIELADSKRTQRLGWVEQPFELEDGSTVRMYWHNGATYGNTSFVAFIPELETSIVALSNTGKSVDQLAIDILTRSAKVAD